MEYARVELRWVFGGWSRGALVQGAVGGRVRGVVVDPAELRVASTLLAPLRRRESLPRDRKLLGDERTPTPPQFVTLTRGCVALRGRQRVGVVVALWCDNATGVLRHALVSPGRALLGRRMEYVLDAAHIQGVGKNTLALTDDAPALDALALYRPDADLEHDVAAALRAALANPNARRGVKFFVQDGAIHLGGLVETDEEVAQACDAVAHIAGLRGVTADLVSTESLAERVEERLALTLAAQGATEGSVRVLAEHGIIYLEGAAPTQETSMALEQAAHAVAGVRVVLNHLVVQE
jgi:osmotically-inducible protein OsmY